MVAPVAAEEPQEPAVAEPELEPEPEKEPEPEPEPEPSADVQAKNAATKVGTILFLETKSIL